MWCLENLLRFLSKNAYIMMAIHGTNFCTSARDAFSLLARNVVRVIVLDKITDFLLCMGKLAITLSFGREFYAYLCRLFAFRRPVVVLLFGHMVGSEGTDAD